eukprot:2095976-Rhodomonas_salina.2
MLWYCYRNSVTTRTRCTVAGPFCSTAPKFPNPGLQFCFFSLAAGLVVIGISIREYKHRVGSYLICRDVDLGQRAVTPFCLLSNENSGKVCNVLLGAFGVPPHSTHRSVPGSRCPCASPLLVLAPRSRTRCTTQPGLTALAGPFRAHNRQGCGGEIPSRRRLVEGRQARKSRNQVISGQAMVVRVVLRCVGVRNPLPKATCAHNSCAQVSA